MLMSPLRASRVSKCGAGGPSCAGSALSRVSRPAISTASGLWPGLGLSDSLLPPGVIPFRASISQGDGQGKRGHSQSIGELAHLAAVGLPELSYCDSTVVNERRLARALARLG